MDTSRVCGAAWGTGTRSWGRSAHLTGAVNTWGSALAAEIPMEI